MQDIMQELAGYQPEFEALVDGWNTLFAEERIVSWVRYTLMDEGEGTSPSYSRLLINVRCEGWAASQRFDSGAQVA